MDPSVRKQKSGDQLAVGDWLAPGEQTEGAAEVLFAHAYRASADSSRDNDGTRVQLVLREQGKQATYPDVVTGTTLFDLASEEDLAERSKAAERAERIAEIRQLADWLEQNPYVPVPHSVGAWEQMASPSFGDGISTEQGLALVRKVAAQLGVKPDESDPTHTEVRIAFGKAEYKLLTWHKGGRPAEPAPEPYLGWDGPCAASLHIPTPGQTCGVCSAEGVRSAQHVETMAWASDTCSAECACGMVVSGFDSLAEAQEALARHIADPTGQDYGRADTAEADDPTPVSPARVPAHFADGRTGAEIEHFEARGWKADVPGSAGVACACEVAFDGFDTLAEAKAQLVLHIEAATSPTGLTIEPCR